MSRADVVRTAYDALGRGGLAAVEAAFAPDAVWHLPGRSAFAGTHRGGAAIRDGVLVRLDPLSGGTFRDERLAVTGCQLIRVEGEKIVEMRGHDSDQYALDEFWR